MIVTVKLNTLAQTCDGEGNLSDNIRPFHFSIARDCEVVKSGWSRDGSYQWFVVQPFSGYVFVTTRDVSNIRITDRPVVAPVTMVDRLARALANCNAD